MGGDFLHKDIKSIIINGTEYPIELNSSGTGFTTTDSNFIAKTDVLSLNGSPIPDANLYFKTNAVVGGIKTDYTLYIGDEKSFLLLIKRLYQHLPTSLIMQSFTIRQLPLPMKFL